MQEVNLRKLVDIMDELRIKCPWDRKQTLHSLRQQTIEELYELIDAADREDWPGMKEELGDLLLHIVFYSKIATEKDQFNIQQVIDSISEKLIKRHPHIYGDVKAEDAETVKRNWEKIKLSEGKKSVMSGVPAALPALVKAQRIQQKAAQVGFEWKQVDDVWEKVKEEKQELEDALKNSDSSEAEKEAGDLLFSLVNYIRFLGIDVSNALEKTNKKFISRFQQMENIAASEQHKQLYDLSLDEMDAIWNRIKKES